jgi:hypothetical protein
MSKARSSTQYLGVRAILPPDLQMALRAPTSADRAYVKGTLWLNTAAAAAYMWPGTGSWISLGSAAAGTINTLTGGSGGALNPAGGNISLLGTANQITSTGSGSTITLSLPSAIIAPGSITATLGAITATNGNLVLGTAGNKIVIATGANASVGTSSAMTAGAVTVATTASSATAKVFYVRATTGGTPGHVSITAQDGTGFTLTSSSGSETSTFNWWIINA